LIGNSADTFSRKRTCANKMTFQRDNVRIDKNSNVLRADVSFVLRVGAQRRQVEGDSASIAPRYFTNSGETNGHFFTDPWR